MSPAPANFESSPSHSMDDDKDSSGLINIRSVLSFPLFTHHMLSCRTDQVSIDFMQVQHAVLEALTFSLKPKVIKVKRNLMPFRLCSNLMTQLSAFQVVISI